MALEYQKNKLLNKNKGKLRSEVFVKDISKEGK
jgi:hypothetical protein